MLQLLAYPANNSSKPNKEQDSVLNTFMLAKLCVVSVTPQPQILFSCTGVVLKQQ